MCGGARRQKGSGLHTYFNGQVTLHWARGPGHKIMFFGIGDILSRQGTLEKHRVWLIALEKNKRIAIQDMNSTGGC